VIRPALVLAALSVAPSALAAEYRAFTLTDGRTFVAEVLSTEATGMRVRVPAGETTVPFEQLVDMVPVEESAYLSQDEWLVYVAADGAYQSGFAAAFHAIPGVVVADDATASLSGEERRAAAVCGADLACVVDALDGNARWMWVVVGKMEGADAVFEGATTKGATRTRSSAPRSDVGAVNAAAWQVLGLTPHASSVVSLTPEPEEPEPKGPRTPREPREREPMTSERATALSFIPLPGAPNAAAGDWAGFGIGLAAVIPATVVWVGATGKASQSAGGHVAMALGGYYAATVATNHILSATRLRDRGIAVGVAPTRGEGAQVTVTIVR